MEENGKMRSTVARRLSTLASFYRYCEQERLIERNPAANVRRPKVDYESLPARPVLLGVGHGSSGRTVYDVARGLRSFVESRQRMLTM